jgi:hypothetical protein
MGKHFQTMILGRKQSLESSDYGIWHESYKVRAGEYDGEFDWLIMRVVNAALDGGTMLTVARHHCVTAATVQLCTPTCLSAC